jgi:hypothetical protein
MIEVDFSMWFVPGPAARRQQMQKKADVIEHVAVFHHVGLLVNRPPGTAGVPFI